MKDFFYWYFVTAAAMLLILAPVHEKAHAEVYDKHGCEDINISYIPDLSENRLAYTEANCPIKVVDEVEAKQLNVHIVQKLLYPVIMLLLVAASAGLTLVFRKSDNSNVNTR